MVAGPRQPAWVHALVAVCNEAFGNAGRTVRYRPAADPDRVSHRRAIADLAAALADGDIETLLVIGGNPAHDAPADLDLPDLLAAVPFTARLGLHDDETSAVCRWHLPRAHWLESWSDAVDCDGRYAVAQPLIAPLFQGRTPAEFVSLIAHEQVRAAARLRLAGLDFERSWRRLLREGSVAGSRAPAGPMLQPGAAAAIAAGAARPAPRLDAGNLEITFAPDRRLHDGRFANNAWLQELPDCMTKLTWDNAAVMSPATARSLGVADGDLLSLELEGRVLEAPALILPGHAPWSVTLTLGHGRDRAGRVGDGVGRRAYALRTTAAFAGAAGVRAAPAGRKVELAVTQDHFALDAAGMAERERRAATLVVEGTLDEYRRDPAFAAHRQHHPPLESLWTERPGEGRRWGMAIDLNACIGCNACVAACQAENNIPVVGREQVIAGREMHWLRLDRYFSGDPEDARVVQQPVACMHCELAPCEQVCPVGATMHSAEGLNVMVYNRCVGTRYCSNNCPYKVRRFNFFNYNKDPDPLAAMGRNPEVTLRARGVMEKCTYCVQRIEEAKIRAKNQGRPLRDGEIEPACQQACPTRAIVFGDLADPGSEVARLQADDRAYRMLAELNIKPRTAYLARLRNPNPELAESDDASRHPAH